MASSTRSHIPPLGWHGLTGFYDGIATLTMRRHRYFPQIVDRCRAHGGDRILDVGSGTGALSHALRRALPDKLIVSTDPDWAASKLGLNARRIDQPCLAMGQMLPYCSESFDIVTSSLMFHHLELTQKTQVLEETSRILRPYGLLVIADLGPAQSSLMSLASWSVRLLDGFSCTRENFSGAIPAMMEAADFQGIEALPIVSTAAGTVWHYIGWKSA